MAKNIHICVALERAVALVFHSTKTVGNCVHACQCVRVNGMDLSHTNNANSVGVRVRCLIAAGQKCRAVPMFTGKIYVSDKLIGVHRQEHSIQSKQTHKYTSEIYLQCVVRIIRGEIRTKYEQLQK